MNEKQPGAVLSTAFECYTSCWLPVELGREKRLTAFESGVGDLDDAANAELRAAACDGRFCNTLCIMRLPLEILETSSPEENCQTEKEPNLMKLQLKKATCKLITDC